jgi:hypothetical protein
MSRESGVAHIRWAVEVEKSGLCTPDYLDQEATRVGLHYLTHEIFQSRVEQQRGWLFDEMPRMYPDTLWFREMLVDYMARFDVTEEERRSLIASILRIVHQKFTD